MKKLIAICLILFVATIVSSHKADANSEEVVPFYEQEDNKGAHEVHFVDVVETDGKEEVTENAVSSHKADADPGIVHPGACPEPKHPYHSLSPNPVPCMTRY